MDTENQFNFNHWTELWMQQSKDFFETTNETIKNIFTKHSPVNPEEHLKQINQWLEQLKNQWRVIPFLGEQPPLYWKMIANMYDQAANLTLERWIKRSREKNPINTINELYELWLNCCREECLKATESKAYQEAYAEFMKSTLQFWERTLSK